MGGESGPGQVDGHPRITALGSLALFAPTEEQSWREHALPPGKPRRLLAYLLAQAGTVVRADAIADVLWGSAQPEHATGAVQTVVSRLRASLRDVGLDGALRTSHPGYLLTIDAPEFDAALFRQYAERGRAALQHDPRRAAALLDSALALWHGPAYGEFAAEEFVAADVAALDELRRTAREDRAEAALRLGEPAEAAVLAERVLADDPVRERPQGQLMLALHRLGRHDEALAAFDRYRRALDRELGLEPSPALRELDGRIRRRDDRLIAAVDRGHAAAPVDRGRSDDLPAAHGPLIGRDDLAASLCDDLHPGSLITLIGPGGVGKTRLAVHVAGGPGLAGRYPDGVWLVELAALQHGATVVRQMMTALSVQPVPGSEDIDRLIGALARKRVLVLLDNCEHVVDEVADIVDAIERSCPAIAVLATSRVPLGLAEERVVPVPPLSTSGEPDAELSDAARLFIDRARSIVPHFTPARQALPALEELCRRLDGLPLAIELAAARMQFMTPAEVLEHLPERLGLMRNPQRFASGRHQTLQAVVDWSYQLLAAPDQRLFADLAVFTGGFSLSDAAGLTGLDPVGVLARVEVLVDHSMLVAAPDPASGVTTYSMLHTLRSYGRERLEERDDADAVHRAHLDLLITAIERGQSALETPECGRWAREIGGRLDDIRAAFDWAARHDPGRAVRLAGGLADWNELQMVAEVAGWAAAALERWERDGDPEDRPYAGAALALLTSYARNRGDRSVARELAERGLALLDDDDPSRRRVAASLAKLSLDTGDLDAARRHCDELREWSEHAGDELRSGFAEVTGAMLRAAAGDLRGAVEQGQRYLRERRSYVTLPWAHYLLGTVLRQVDPVQAVAHLDRAYAGGEDNGDRCVMGLALTTLAALHQRHGDPARAVAVHRTAFEHWNRTDNWMHLASATRGTAALMLRLDDPRSALTLLAAVRAPRRAARLADSGGRLEQLEQAATAALPPGDAATARARGHLMTDPDLIRFVSDWLDRAVPDAPDA